MSTQAEKASELELEAMKENRAAKQAKGPLVGMPFGKRRSPEPYLQVTASLPEYGKLFSNPETLMDEKTWEPSVYRLAWPVKTRPETEARIHAGIYIPVQKSELKKDALIGLTHKGTDNGVYLFEHILVKVPERYAKEIWDKPVSDSIQRLVANEQSFKEDVEVGSRGIATATVERTDG